MFDPHNTLQQFSLFFSLKTHIFISFFVPVSDIMFCDCNHQVCMFYIVQGAVCILPFERAARTVLLYLFYFRASSARKLEECLSNAYFRILAEALNHLRYFSLFFEYSGLYSSFCILLVGILWKQTYSDAGPVAVQRLGRRVHDSWVSDSRMYAPPCSCIFSE